MQSVAQYMQLGVAPRNELTVVPDEAVAIVEGDDCHGSPVIRFECYVIDIARGNILNAYMST